MTTHTIEFRPNPVQKGFIESRAEADLFCSRMGEGKSTALCWAALYHTRHNPGACWALIRDTFENIKGTTMKTFFEWFPPGVCGTYHGGNKTFTWASGIAEGEVIFMGLDDAADASKLMSRALAGFGIDEPAPASGNVGVDEFIFDMAMSRLRQDGMKWYTAKLAENNPDETHWTYKRFVAPGQENYHYWQPSIPENATNLRPGYYASLRRLWAHRPDLVRRFVDGEFGFQAIGKQVTPQWSDRLHLALELVPLPRTELALLWDFGSHPCCIITQRTPLGHWLILDAVHADGAGIEELINDQVRPVLEDRYKPLKCGWRHIGDPSGSNPEQSSYHRSAVRLLRKELGGTWRPGPVPIQERVYPLQAVLTRAIGGKGLVQVDRERAAAVWHALRGGWHYHVARTGLISGVPVKGHPESDIGDAMGYGAALLFPLGRASGPDRVSAEAQGSVNYFDGGIHEVQVVITKKDTQLGWKVEDRTGDLTGTLPSGTVTPYTDAERRFLPGTSGIPPHKLEEYKMAEREKQVPTEPEKQGTLDLEDLGDKVYGPDHKADDSNEQEKPGQ